MKRLNFYSKYFIFFGIPSSIILLIIGYKFEVPMDINFGMFFLGFSIAAALWELKESGILPLNQNKCVKEVKEE